MVAGVKCYESYYIEISKSTLRECKKKYYYSEDCVSGGAVRGGVDCRKSCELNQHDKIAKFIDRIVSIREFCTITSWMKIDITYVDKALTVKQGRIHGIRRS